MTDPSAVKRYRERHPQASRYAAIRYEYAQHGKKLPAEWRTVNRFEDWVVAQGLGRGWRLLPAFEGRLVSPSNFTILETKRSAHARGANFPKETTMYFKDSKEAKAAHDALQAKIKAARGVEELNALDAEIDAYRAAAHDLNDRLREDIRYHSEREVRALAELGRILSQRAKNTRETANFLDDKTVSENAAAALGHVEPAGNLPIGTPAQRMAARAARRGGGLT